MVQAALIIGGSGQVGTWLLRTTPEGWNSMGTTTQRPHPSLLYLDITDDIAVKGLINTLRPHIVFHTAAYTHVDGCEEHPERSQRINVEGTRSVAQACADIGVKLVFFSSEYIFDGKHGPYTETDKPRPLNIYGKHKLEAETICQELNPTCLIVRPTVVYSYLPTSKNFAMQLIDSFEKDVEIKAITDQISTPTYAPNLASLTWELVKRNAEGIFNVVGPDLMNRDQFAHIIAEIFNFNSSLIMPVKTKDISQRAKRPLKAGLSNQKLVGYIGITPVGVKRALEDMKHLANMDETG